MKFWNWGPTTISHYCMSVTFYFSKSLHPSTYTATSALSQKGSALTQRFRLFLVQCVCENIWAVWVHCVYENIWAVLPRELVTRGGRGPRMVMTPINAISTTHLPTHTWDIFRFHVICPTSPSNGYFEGWSALTLFSHLLPLVPHTYLNPLPPIPHNVPPSFLYFFSR